MSARVDRSPGHVDPRPGAVAHLLTEMTHEARGSLNAILGFADLLGAEVFGQLNAEQRRAVTDILAAASRLHRLVEHTALLARATSGGLEVSPEVVSVRAMCDGVARGLADAARDRLVTITVQVPDGLAAWADEGLLRLALRAVTENAVKYSREGGRVDLIGRAETGRAVVEVVDHGCGIAAGALQSIFEPFVSTDALEGARAGSGLGLTIARALLTHMGGAVNVVSTVGAGTTFALELPRCDPPDA